MRRLSFAVVSLSALVAAMGVACGSSSPGNNNNGGGDSGTNGNQNPQDSGSNNTTGDGSVNGNGDSGNNNPGDAGGNSDTGATGPTFDGGSPSTVYPALHAPWPNVIDQGGPILTTPDTLTVTFNADPNAATYVAFGAQATSATNAYWTQVRAGICETGTTTCVGTGTGTSKALTETLATSYTDSSQGGASTLQTFIQGLITAKSITVTANTLLLLYFPATTTISLDGAMSCQQFGGYHNSMTDSKNVQFTYAVLPECAAQKGQVLSVAQETIFAASHEIAEAASDPFATQTTSGYYLDFNDPRAIIPWNGLGGGEIGDMCVDLFWGLGQDEYTENSYIVQRIWNPTAATAGGDPCVPAQPATKPYFNVATRDWLVTEEVGTTTTFLADGFSNMAVPAGWSVMGYDLNATSATNLFPYLGISLNGATAGAAVNTNNGEEVQVAITLKTDPGALTQSAGGAMGLLISFDGTSPAKATQGTFWPFLVQSPEDALDSGLTGLDASNEMPRRRQIKPLHVTKEQLEKAWKTIREIYQ